MNVYFAIVPSAMIYFCFYLIFQLLFVISFCHGSTVTSVTESTITLTWPAGDYENFTIFYSGEDGLNHTTTVSEWSGDNATAVIDDHLEAGQLYTIDIRGHTLSNDTFSVVQVFSQATSKYCNVERNDDVVCRRICSRQNQCCWQQNSPLRCQYFRLFKINY